MVTNASFMTGIWCQVISLSQLSAQASLSLKSKRFSHVSRLIQGHRLVGYLDIASLPENERSKCQWTCCKQPSTAAPCRHAMHCESVNRLRNFWRYARQVADEYGGGEFFSSTVHCPRSAFVILFLLWHADEGIRVPVVLTDADSLEKLLSFVWYYRQAEVAHLAADLSNWLLKAEDVLKAAFGDEIADLSFEKLSEELAGKGSNELCQDALEILRVLRPTLRSL